MMTAMAGLGLKGMAGAFVFDGTPINEGLVRLLHSGSFLAEQRNVVLVGGTGTGKTHLAAAITANVVRAGARGQYFNAVDLVNRLEEENRLGKAGTLAKQLSRLDVVVLDELGYLPFARSGGQAPEGPKGRDRQPGARAGAGAPQPALESGLRPRPARDRPAVPRAALSQRTLAPDSLTLLSRYQEPCSPAPVR
jgi:Cdc6-like AAA superfamily ATPase